MLLLDVTMVMKWGVVWWIDDLNGMGWMTSGRSFSKVARESGGYVTMVISVILEKKRILIFTAKLPP